MSATAVGNSEEHVGCTMSPVTDMSLRFPQGLFHPRTEWGDWLLCEHRRCELLEHIGFLDGHNLRAWVRPFDHRTGCEHTVAAGQLCSGCE
jgi:hypothetical protein